MKTSTFLGYGLVALVTFAPAGVRVLTWKKPKPHDLGQQTVQTGEMLFKHEWKPNDPLSPSGDGLGPVFNAKSCLACHNQGGPGGGGDLVANVTTFSIDSHVPVMTSGAGSARGGPRQGVVHAFAVNHQETLSQVHPDLPPISRPVLSQLVPTMHQTGAKSIVAPFGVHLSQRNTPALFGARLIDRLSDRDIIAIEKAQQVRWGMASAKTEDLPVGRALRLPDGRIGHFGWKAQSASLSDFVQAACANELGLGNPGSAQPKPLGKSDYQPPGLDLTLEQCDQITSFIASLPQPIEVAVAAVKDRELALAGKKMFHRMGCAECHTPDIGSVKGIYSDLLLHNMGVQLQQSGGGGSYNDPIRPNPEQAPTDGPEPGEWRTPPLWGVADSAPYLHDGRAPTLEEAIRQHGGQGAKSARAFAGAYVEHQTQLISFLKTLRAPAP